MSRTGSPRGGPTQGVETNLYPDSAWAIVPGGCENSFDGFALLVRVASSLSSSFQD
jgi:hypothetical protein